MAVMQKAPRLIPQLPIEQPIGAKWEVRVVSIFGRFALSVRRPGQKSVYPNAVVEKVLKIPGTTRSWSAFEKVCAILSRDLN